MNLESQRQQEQLAFIESGTQIEVGNVADLPLSLVALASTTPDSEHVLEVYSSGLTALVFKIKAGGRFWTLKCKRPKSLVKNVDGQTSFLNEVQRRNDLDQRKRASITAPLFPHIVETAYASLRDGIILSPWANGNHLQRFDGRVYDQLFSTIVNLELCGFFEWDFCPGNILDDGQRLVLFDFGYMYRFDPRKQFNSNGLEAPLFNGIERFETRNFFDFLLRNPKGLGESDLLETFREEKSYALKHYVSKLIRLEAMGASEVVMHWHRAIIQRWEKALGCPNALQKLYLLEGFRSNVLDLLDDLHGQSCSAGTLKRADSVVSLLKEHFTLLKQEKGLFFGDEKKNKTDLISKYLNLKTRAVEYLPG